MWKGLQFVFVALFGASLAGAQEAPAEKIMADDEVFVSRTLSVGIAAGLMRFDSNFKFTNPSNGNSIFVDAESTLGLPESEAIPMIYGYWRPSERHGLGFSYFNIRRQSELLGIDQSFEDLDVVGNIQLTDQSRFYALTYNYTIFQDARAFLIASVGVNALDLEYRLDAEGSLTLDGTPITSGQLTESVRQLTPFPMFGIDGWFVLTDKWSFGARAAFVAGTVGDVSALITESRIRTKYTVNDNVGVFFGINYFDGDIKIAETDLRTDINYGLDGLIVGIDVGF